MYVIEYQNEYYRVLDKEAKAGDTIIVTKSDGEDLPSIKDVVSSVRERSYGKVIYSTYFESLLSNHPDIDEYYVIDPQPVTEEYWRSFYLNLAEYHEKRALEYREKAEEGAND